MESDTDVLDLLFQPDNPLIETEHTMIETSSSFKLSDLDTYSDDIMALLNDSGHQVVQEDDFLNQHAPSPSSDSGVSSGPTSPPSSDKLSEASLYNQGSPLSDQSSPVRMDDNLDLSPLPVENFEMSGDFDFASLLQEAGINLPGNSGDADVSIDLGWSPDSEDSNDVNNYDHTERPIHVVRVSKDGTLPFTTHDISTDEAQSCKPYPDLALTDEEKILLAREGYELPSHLPLTKEEERLLKAVRRKIRNKASAKNSRKKKEDYMKGLEHRVKSCTVENKQLHKKVQNLEKDNLSLITQLKRLQAMVQATMKPAQTGTCVMVLVLSFAFIILPSWGPFADDVLKPMGKIQPMAGRSRNLLQEYSDLEEPYDISIRPGPPWEIPPKTPAIHLPPPHMSPVKTNNEDVAIPHEDSKITTDSGKRTVVNISIHGRADTVKKSGSVPETLDSNSESTQSLEREPNEVDGT